MSSSKIRIYQSIFILAIGLFLANHLRARFALLEGFPPLLFLPAGIAGILFEMRLRRLFPDASPGGGFGFATGAVAGLVLVYPLVLILNGAIPLSARTFGGTVLKKHLAYGKSPRNRDAVPITELDVASRDAPGRVLRMRVDMETFAAAAEGRPIELPVMRGALGLEFYVMKRDQFSFPP
ncbi:MAG TPA: hypothetical protein PLP29_18300 [Candidatus Ozemobacteraceae bacterium]|nr:hypothetical protein [Candidatus Ozemobacteraceae bacterium]